MRTARSALQYARQLAPLLGSGWTADSCGHTDLALLRGPVMSLDVTTVTPIRASSPVTVGLSLPGSLVWPRRGEFQQKVTGTIGSPQALADEIRAVGLPAWTQTLAELEQRTARTRCDLQAFMDEAAQMAGPQAQVSYESRPGVADLRWPGGRAVVHVDEEGHACVRHLVLSDLTASAFTQVLRAIGPTEDRPSSAVPPIGLML